MAAAESEVVEVYIGAADARRMLASFPPGTVAGRVGCQECAGTGWWGYGPEESVNGPCVACKGTGLSWVGL